MISSKLLGQITQFGINPMWTLSKTPQFTQLSVYIMNVKANFQPSLHILGAVINHNTGNQMIFTNADSYS